MLLTSAYAIQVVDTLRYHRGMQKCQQKCQNLNINDFTFQIFTLRSAMFESRWWSVLWNIYFTWFPRYLTNMRPHIRCIWVLIDCLCRYKMFKHSGIMLICSYRLGPMRWGLDGRVTRREEFTGQQGSQLRFYGEIYTLCDFTSRRRIR